MPSRLYALRTSQAGSRTESLPQKSPSSIIDRNGPLSNPTPAVRPWPRELVFMPHTCHSLYPSGSAQWGGELPSRIGLAGDARDVEAVIRSLKPRHPSAPFSALPLVGRQAEEYPRL
jgi:hypothetical protein